MDLGIEKQALQEKLQRAIRKLKYPLLIAAVGIAVLLVPTGRKPAEAATAPPTVQSDSEDLEAQLTELLSKLSGAGRVTVMLTLDSGGRTEYEKDTQVSVRADTTETRATTVVSSGGALVSSVSSPSYRGAVVLCEGADSAEVRYNIVNAVSCLTGLSGDKITVLKMKGSSEE